MFCASGVLCPCFLQEFHHTCQAGMLHLCRSLCTSFLKGALSHFSHSPCYFPVPSSSVFSAAFLLLAVWRLDQKAIFVPWVENCSQEVKRLGVYAVKTAASQPPAEVFFFYCLLALPRICSCCRLQVLSSFFTTKNTHTADILSSL